MWFSSCGRLFSVDSDIARAEYGMERAKLRGRERAALLLAAKVPAKS